MKQIHKYEIPVNDETTRIEVPNNSKVLMVGDQKHGYITLWLEVDIEKPLVEWSFRVLGTGFRFDGNKLVHVGSIIQKPFVWHLYMVVGR